ncbi:MULTISPECIES: catabolite repressor/activator [Pseudomonas]|uniref:DNA-binding transcriptional regulator FruR n=1 Tax=Pseudomonas cichorii TaxID=36746 RepID=A0A3M4W0E7_PSECI|nr:MULTISPECIES: catabolite repressor/activator [Pseudomonas]AHF69461.1 DNA-binding transcriptional regulator FruR [Pseudomonas cichorii JBC1]QVE16398.1 catabolite repressor/activator [Pseudomonas cichorii]RMR57109.1 DNA-binding transcriptional regulator FruR [Pseudomonas cichorii]SDN72305.1 transcriptional regulator, LacI family [Pseudomonas cichorii]GFM78410.1 DNA-binding transcriptional regulator FruR [Pseudomonas cichorii]
MKLSDIARLAGVSVTTASYVINGKAEQQRISPATVERVKAVVEQHDFRPNPQAAGLRTRHSRTLGFILPDLENPSYARIAKLLEQGARARGYQLLIASSDDDPASELQLLQVFRARRCDALLVASCLPASNDSYRELQNKGLPIIAIDREMNAEFFCSVVSDDHDASLQLTRSLLQTNPEHIALLGARPELSVSQSRADGFRHALGGFTGTTTIEHGEAFSRECGQRLMSDMLQRLGHLPDALITTSYVLLQGVFDVLQSQSLNPAQLHLGTFGDTQLLDFLPLPVNAMAQQHQLIAEKALQLALAAIENDQYEPGVHAIVRTFKQRIHEG